MRIRRANQADLVAITGIYNEAVLNTTATFDTEPKTLVEQEEWFRQHAEPPFLVLVAEEDGIVVGWASLGPWSDRRAYAETAQCSVYVHGDCRGKGIGKALLQDLLAAAKEAGLHTVIGSIAEGNEASMRLVVSLGFDHLGTMREVGFKFGKRLDVLMVQRIL